MISLHLSNQLIQVIIFQVLSLVIRRRRSYNNYIKSAVSCCTLYGKERIVQVVCGICAGGYIGPIRQAGGFLSGHMAYHDWEFKMMMSSEQGLVA